ncbi:MAG: thioredoxin domain-containing protein [Candidatus Omnitrophica bacterium]|nr:thioredoxin domain-containing protein [Candidatus Omnitrophota bacterium]
MDWKKFFNTMLLILVGIFAAMSLIICMSLSVRAGIAPMWSTMREMIAMQKSLDAKLTEGVIADNATLNERLTALENQLKAMQQRPGAFQGGAQARVQEQPPAEDMNKVYNLPAGDSYVLGNPKAKITFVEFSDFECPFCTRFHPVLAEVLKAFPNDVNLIIKNYPLPFHQQAIPAAKAALAAGIQGKYYEMVGAIMDNHKGLSDDKYKELAGQIGLNVAQFLKDLKEKDADFNKTIKADMELGQKSDVRGTPTYFINGKKSQARDMAGWKAEVEALLKK